FGKFSKEMQDYLELRIIRTWRFGDTLTVDDQNPAI
ncbi:MAG TPA: energy transducer TonB, partial [Moraxellaceae bacterium]|nr:energy transducer TonB [Moraxellaceae bacterium]